MVMEDYWNQRFASTEGNPTFSQVEDQGIVFLTPVPEIKVFRNDQWRVIGLFDIRFVRQTQVKDDTPSIGANSYFELELESGEFLKVANEPHSFGVTSRREADNTVRFLRDLLLICDRFTKGELVDGSHTPYFTEYARWIKQMLKVDIEVSIWDKINKIY